MSCISFVALYIQHNNTYDNDGRRQKTEDDCRQMPGELKIKIFEQTTYKT